MIRQSGTKSESHLWLTSSADGPLPEPERRFKQGMTNTQNHEKHPTTNAPEGRWPDLSSVCPLAKDTVPA